MLIGIVPFYLRNFLFKIIPKILADRLGPIAHSIISPQLATFLKVHIFVIAFGLDFEVFNFMDKKVFGGNVVWSGYCQSFW